MTELRAGSGDLDAAQCPLRAEGGRLTVLQGSPVHGEDGAVHLPDANQDCKGRGGGPRASAFSPLRGGTTGLLRVRWHLSPERVPPRRNDHGASVLQGGRLAGDTPDSYS